MSRDEFMRQLEMLLQDISPDERQEALQYYNDYLDDAGAEQEAQVLKELGSPEKVAAIILEGLSGRNDDSSEYRETGYADTRFEEKESPQIRGYQNQRKSQRANTGQGQDTYRQDTYKGEDYQQYGSSTGYNPNYQQEKRKDSAVPKVLLILAIIFIGLPVVLPLGLAAVILVIGLVFGFFALIIGLAVGCVAVAISGVILFICGLVKVVTNLAVGFMLMGGGLIMGALGVIGTAVFIKICLIVVPGLFRGVVNLCRRPFHRKAV